MHAVRGDLPPFVHLFLFCDVIAHKSNLYLHTQFVLISHLYCRHLQFFQPTKQSCISIEDDDFLSNLSTLWGEANMIQKNASLSHERGTLCHAHYDISTSGFIFVRTIFVQNGKWSPSLELTPTPRQMPRDVTNISED